MNPSQLLDRLKKINLNEIYRNEVLSLEPEIIDENISQLSKGEGFDGSKFETYKYEDYYKFKSSEGLTEQAGKNYNFLLTGEFREGFFTEFVSANDFKIDSKDSKRNRLQKLGDEKVFGLQAKSKQNIKSILLPNMREEYRKQLGL